jgi:tetratricopeptide (TPR) repeat protein
MTDQQPSQPRLSVVMIARDAEQLLTETLESVRDIADEIVVCDTQSSDNTVEVAARLANRVIQCPWTDDFSAARNACLEHVTGDWVLWLDAGEQLDGQDAAGLREFLDEADRSRAYLLLIKVQPPNESVAAEQVARVRLVPRHPGIRFRGRVRESLTESLGEAGITVEGLQCGIHRGRREHDADVKAFRARRNLRLCELASQDGRHTELRNCEAEAHADLDNCIEAARLYRAAIKTADRGSASMLEAYYGLLKALDGVNDALAAQISVCLEALETYPLDAQLLCALGGYLQRQGQTDLATRSYESAYRFGQVTPEVWHLQEIAPFAAICYSTALQLSGQDERAHQVLTEAVERDPDSTQLHRQILELHVKHGRTEDALAQLEQWPGPPSNVDALRAAVRGASLAGQKDWSAARSYLQTAYAAGCRDVVCLRWLSVTLLSVGETDEAETILREWSEIDPANEEPQRYLTAVETARTTGTPVSTEIELEQSDSHRTDPGPTDPSARKMRIDQAESANDRARKPLSVAIESQFFVTRKDG